ncbi:Metallo-hydrolase oxidoreductase [Pisolithus albus]|nr:Metallo-hydrolase oxidoreductase [Pisolithus albus]
MMSITPGFKARPLTSSTFLITEWDNIHNPFVYAKFVLVVRTTLILDTGCGGASNGPAYWSERSKRIHRNSARRGTQPLRTPEDGWRTSPYNRHILGMEAFGSDSVILGSEHEPTFPSPDNLAAHSLCALLDIRTPLYKLNLVPHLHDIVSAKRYPWESRCCILPEEVNSLLRSISCSLWFANTRTRQGQGQLWPRSGHRTGNQGPSSDGVREGCGIRKEPPRRHSLRRGQRVVEYTQRSGQLFLICPERLVSEAQKVKSV